ncbi:MAG TPA: polysaccharide deacetylase family protein [Candidatus Limnocylindrales bacterium]|nr:polysaccharide deacetylase family protein [Candidatus Limnocylindrales bacterium]
MDDPELEPSRPAPPRSGTPLATPGGAAALAVVLVALVAAILLVPGMLPGPVASASPGATATPGGTPAGSPTQSPVPTFVRPTPTPLPTFMSYVVRAGDSLNSIADDFRTTARSIAWWNRGTYPNLDPQSADYEPDHIEPGWVLVLIPGVEVDDANPPTPSPGPSTPSPTLGPTASPGGSPVAGGPATVVSHGTRGTGQIALTFDMGGRLDPAVEIVQWLIDHDVHATLFPTGASGTTTTEGRAALELAATRPDLFAVGNHSWDHPDFTTLTAAQMADQLASTDDAIRDLIGMPTTPWFRPPYGAWTYDVRVGVGAAGWSRLVMWDIDTIDWRAPADGGPTADDIVTKVISKAQGGSIVLMHLGGWNTLEALPDLLGGLQSRGLTPVTLAEMQGT